jgi:DNA helicase HerA-like ATPase
MEALGNAAVKNTVKTLNRHGLIAGATGTGKTKPFKYFLNNYLLLDTGIDDGHQR